MRGESEKEGERGEGRKKRKKGGEGAETSIAARLQIHGKPPHEEYWQQLNIPVEVLNRREGAKTDSEREEGYVEREGERVEKERRGGEGEQVVQSVESYISSRRLLGRLRLIQVCCWPVFWRR